MSLLYHYTTPAGMKGILDSRSFWASDYRFLNDTSEFRLGLEVINASIIKYESCLKSVSVEAWSLLDDMRKSIDRFGFVALVASFTTNGDLLSQWRGYNNGRGYSIGIDQDWLCQNADAQNFKLFPVLYHDKEHNNAADAAVNLLLEELVTLNNDRLRTTPFVQSWWEHALKVALACKDANFCEEEEHRLAYISHSWPTGIQVRPGTAGLIPYLPCYINKTIIDRPNFHPNNCGLEKIVIGPALREQQMAAVDALLAIHHMRFEIKKSKIPYVAD